MWRATAAVETTYLDDCTQKRTKIGMWLEDIKFSIQLKLVERLVEAGTYSEGEI